MTFISALLEIPVRTGKQKSPDTVFHVSGDLWLTAVLLMICFRMQEIRRREKRHDVPVLEFWPLREGQRRKANLPSVSPPARSTGGFSSRPTAGLFPRPVASVSAGLAPPPPVRRDSANVQHSYLARYIPRMRYIYHEVGVGGAPKRAAVFMAVVMAVSSIITRAQIQPPRQASEHFLIEQLRPTAAAFLPSKY